MGLGGLRNHPSLQEPTHHDRRYHRHLRAGHHCRLFDHARAGGLLGALVRPVPIAHAHSRKARCRVRWPLHLGQGQHRRIAPAGRHVWRAQRAHLHPHQKRAGGRWLHGCATREPDPRHARQARQRRADAADRACARSACRGRRRRSRAATLAAHRIGRAGKRQRPLRLHPPAAAIGAARRSAGGLCARTRQDAAGAPV